MAHRRRLLCIATIFTAALAACSDETDGLDAGPQQDGATSDASPDATTGEDARAPDATPRDSGPDAGPVDTGPTGPREIIFLHTNDEHSHELGHGPEIDDYPIPAPPSNTEIRGGVKRRAKVLQTLRDAAQIARTPVVTVGAGDVMMGTLFHLGDAAGPTVPAIDYAILTALQYDVLTLGNHEFDFGVGTLATALSTGGISPTGQPGVVRIPIVVSNIRFSMSTADDALQNLYSAGGAAGRPLRRTYVQTFGTGARGVKVGFLGLMGFDAALVAPFKTPVKFSLPLGTTPCTANADCPGSLCLPESADGAAASGFCASSIAESDPSVVIPALIADAAGAVAELRAQDVDLVVAVTHVGVDERELSSLAMMGMGPEEATVSEEIVLVKGVDAALAAANVPGIDIVIGGHSHTPLETPLEIPNDRSGITTIIVQAGSYGHYVGKLKMTQASGVDPWVIDTDYSGLETITASISPTGLPTFTELVLDTAIDGLIGGSEDNVISRRADNLIYPGELCDGAFLPNAGDCAGAVPGATGGDLVCIDNPNGPGDRQLDLSGCTFPPGSCNNGTIEGDEMCDGTALGGADCASLGYDGGALTCNANCTFNFSQCVPFFPSIIEAALNFQLLGSPIRNNPAETGDLFFYRLGTTTFDVPIGEPSHESNLINLVTDASRWALNTIDPGSITDPVRIVIEADGTLRDPIQQGMTGQLSFSDLFRVIPLGVSPIENTPGFPLVDFYLRADEVKQGLEIGVNQGLASSAFWLGLSGARFEYDPSLSAGDRVTRISLMDEKQDPWSDSGLGETIFDRSLGAGAYPDGPDRLVHVATSMYVAFFMEGLGICARNDDGIQYEECRDCTTNADCDAQIAAVCDTTAGRCTGGNPVALRLRAFAPINSYGLFQELKEFLALIHYVRNLPNNGALPNEYNDAVPRRACCVGPACTPDRVCEDEGGR